MFTAFPIYIVPLLSGQPLLSGHFLKLRGWPLNRGRTAIRNNPVNYLVRPGSVIVYDFRLA